MNKFYIVVEGDADVVFIQQLVKVKLNLNIKKGNFIKIFTNSKSLTNNDVSTVLTTTDNLAHPTIFILDADADNFKSTKEALFSSFKEKKILLKEENVFLFPNDSSDGCLEDLLFELILEDKATPIFKCFESYKNCIRKIDNTYYPPDALKAKIFAYADVLTGKGGEGKRDYTNQDIWDLNSPSLDPLINFLKKHLIA